MREKEEGMMTERKYVCERISLIVIMNPIPLPSEVSQMVPVASTDTELGTYTICALHSEASQSTLPDDHNVQH